MGLGPTKTPGSRVIQAIHDELDRLTVKLNAGTYNSDDCETIVSTARSFLDPSWKSYLIDWSK